MKSLFLTLTFTFVLASMAHAVDADNSNEVIFSYEEGVYSNIALPYRKAHINDVTDKKPALILYLHGGSSKGNDNTTQMGEACIDSICNYLVAKGTNAIFLVPQCPSDKSWGGQMNVVLKGLIDTYVTSGEVDKTRIYIFGGSMGGTGTWTLVSAYPGLFSAAMPVAADPSKCVAENVSQTPALTVMGTSDVIMSVETATDFISKLTALNDDVKMDVEEGWTHEITCVQSYTTERLDWVFSHVKSFSLVEKYQVENRKVKRKNYYTLGGNAVNQPVEAGIYIIKTTYEDDTSDVRKLKM